VDRLKLTVIAHRELEFCNPVSSGRVDRVIALLDLPPGARVFDAGCGKAEMLIRIAERYGARCVGVDTNPHFLADARARAARRVGRAALDLATATDIGARHEEKRDARIEPGHPREGNQVHGLDAG